ncbi:MAG TPA: amino acid permease [Candidatus Polarisedimenticolia bacterium]|nr:amino acid permease [Candidatus Polarisedimenticolia bacterium]
MLAWGSKRAESEPAAPKDAGPQKLGLDAAAALVVAEIIGIGIFLTPAGMARDLGSPLLVLVVWLLVGAAALAGSLCYGELAARFPEAGGGYVYLRQAWGPAVAFLYGWKSLLVMDPGLTAALAAGLGRYAAAVVPLGSAGEKGVAITAILLLAGMSALGMRVAGNVMRLFAVVKLALLAAIIVLGFASAHGTWSNYVPFAAQRAGTAPLVAGLAGGILGAFFAFAGFWDLAKISGEVRDPARTLPRALAIGVGVSTIVYLLVSGAFIRLVPMETAASGPAFAAQAGAALFGASGGVVFAVIVMIAIAGSLAAVIVTAPRVSYAMARDGYLPASIGWLHPRLGTPVRAIALQALLASLVVGLALYDAILGYFVFITLVFLALTVAGLYRLPRPPQGTFRVPGYPWTPVLFLLLLATLLALLGAGRPFEAALGTGVVALGYPVYRLLISPRAARLAEEAP